MGPVVFDAYGTLFDVTAAARRAAAEPGREALAQAWPKLAADWREKQIEYTRLRVIAGVHADFRAVTRDALDWALASAGLAGLPGIADRLMALYDELEAYPEAREAVAALRAAGRTTAILSNGTPAMLEAAVAAAEWMGCSTRSSRSRRSASSSPPRRSTPWSRPSSAAPATRCCSSRPTAGTRPARPASASPPCG